MKPAKPRLCVLLPSHWSANLGGAEIQARFILDKLVELGEFDVHYLARRIAPGFAARGYTVHRIPERRALSGAFLLDLPGLLALLRRLQPDVVYQRVGSAYTGAAAWFCRRHGKKMIWHVSSDRDLAPEEDLPWFAVPRKINKRLVTYGARNASHVVVQNRQQAELLEKHHGRTDAILIRNFQPAPKNALRGKPGQISIFWVGNLKTIKRPDIFLRLARDTARNGNVRFLIAGAPQMQPRAWNAFSDEMRALPNVSYLGPQSLEAVETLLEDAGILVNTSPVEGFPNTFIQAWLRQVPVVSLNVNPDGVFDGGHYGFCAHGSYDLMRRQVDRLVSDAGLRAKIGAEAGAFAREAFGEKNLERLIALCHSGTAFTP